MMMTAEMTNKNKTNSSKKRLNLLDTVRGVAILGMIFIHVSYDIPAIFGAFPPYLGTFGYEVFCQCVRITFIFLSGFCVLLGKKTLKRGLIVSAAGILVTVVSVFIKEPIYFGVLTLIGVCMLLSIPFKKIVTRKNAPVFFFVCLLLFFATIRIHNGYFGIYKHPVFFYPSVLYSTTNPVLTPVFAFLGFPGPRFSSADYFPLFPWFFLFLSGLSFYAWMGETLKQKEWMKLRIEPMTFLGKYSLWVYLIHQPIIYGIMLGIFSLSKIL